MFVSSHLYCNTLEGCPKSLDAIEESLQVPLEMGEMAWAGGFCERRTWAWCVPMKKVAVWLH